jgi:hypothetical protein
MFSGFKKAVLSKRIKNSVEPVERVVNNGIIIYLKVLTSMLESARMIVSESVPVIKKHADAIAEAAVILQPLFEDLKKTNFVKHAEMLSELPKDDPIIKSAVEEISTAVEEIQQAMKEI